MNIKLDMTDYELRKKEKSALTQQEKIARLYALAGKLHVQIGKGERNGHAKRYSDR